MFRYFPHLLVFASAGLSFVCSAAYAETLNQAVSKALQTHPTIEAARASRDIAAEEKHEERSALFPEINANATGGRIFGDNSTSRGLVVNRGEAYSYLWEGSASITQPIFNGWETDNRIEAAKSRINSAHFDVLDSRESIALRATQSYINLVRVQEIIERIDQQKEKFDGYLERIETLVDEGAGDDAEYAQARNIRLLLEDTLIDFNGQLKSAQADYLEAIGALPQEGLIRPALEQGAVPEDMQRAISEAKENHPSVQAGLKELEAAGFSVDAEKGTLFPDLDGELSYLKKDQIEEIGGEVVDARALLRLSWAFSTGGGELARIRRTKAEYSELMARHQETLRTIEREVRVAYAELDTAVKQLGLVRERADITAGLFDTYEAQFEGARVTLLQLMQAENQILNTQLETLNAEYRQLLSRYSVLASLGRLQSALGIIAPAYEESEPPSIFDIDMFGRGETSETQTLAGPAVVPQENFNQDNKPVFPVVDEEIEQQNRSVYPEEDYIHSAPPMFDDYLHKGKHIQPEAGIEIEQQPATQTSLEKEDNTALEIEKTDIDHKDGNEKRDWVNFLDNVELPPAANVNGNVKNVNFNQRTPRVENASFNQGQDVYPKNDYAIDDEELYPVIYE